MGANRVGRELPAKDGIKPGRRLNRRLELVLR
jgi:hypothetical protein